MDDYGYVVKNSDNIYFTGCNGVSNQLRKALIYHSVKYAQDSINELNTNPHRLSSGITRDFKLVKIKIQEINEDDT